MMRPMMRWKVALLGCTKTDTKADAVASCDSSRSILTSE